MKERDCCTNNCFALKGDTQNPSQLLSWQTLRDTTLTALYTEIVRRRVESLKQCQSVTISFDGWTGHELHDGLIGINYHWVDAQWVYHSATLDLVQVLSAHTGTLVVFIIITLLLTIHHPATHLHCMLLSRAQLRLADKQLITASIADNARDVQAAATLLSNGENIGCAAHTAQLVVGDVMGHLTALIEKVKVIDLSPPPSKASFVLGSCSILPAITSPRCCT